MSSSPEGKGAPTESAKSRVLSDAKKIQEGAEFVQDTEGAAPRLEFTKEQIREASAAGTGGSLESESKMIEKIKNDWRDAELIDWRAGSTRGEGAGRDALISHLKSSVGFAQFKEHQGTLWTWEDPNESHVLVFARTWITDPNALQFRMYFEPGGIEVATARVRKPARIPVEAWRESKGNLSAVYTHNIEKGLIEPFPSR